MAWASSYPCFHRSLIRLIRFFSFFFFPQLLKIDPNVHVAILSRKGVNADAAVNATPPPSPQTTFPTMPCQTKLTLPQVVDPTTLPRGAKTLRLRPQRPIEIEPPSPADSQLWGGRGAGGAILKLEGRIVCANPTARVSTLTSHFISRRFLMLAPCVCSCMSTHTHFRHTCVWFGTATLTVTRTVSPSPSP